MEIFGIDNGNARVKTSSGVSFDNRVEIGMINMNKDDIKVKYNGIDYTLGTDNGSLNISRKKHRKPNYKISLLTAIALSTELTKIDCKCVVGVPVETFNDKEFRQDVVSEILKLGEQRINVNGRDRIITIHDAEVFCESGIVFGDRQRFKNEKTLVIDLGGSTVDISLWHGLTLKMAKSYKQGMITLYENIIGSVNDKYTTELMPYEARYMIGKDMYTIKQQSMPISFINTDIDNYMAGLLSYINQYFLDIDSCDSIQLIGGGAIALETWFKDEYDKAVLGDNAEFSNANTFKAVGELKWQQRA